MRQLLSTYEKKPPEIIFEWHDSETEAQGWIVINSLRGGAAGGGTRMRVGLSRYEVESLAKTMEIKFTVSGPPIGGAKSGINFDPKDPRKAGVLERWYRTVKPILKNYYGTGGDMNVDEIKEVIPITEKLGIQHPQEGILNGYFSPINSEKTKIIRQLQDGVMLPLHSKELTPITDGRFTVADMITGYGVSESIKHFYDIYGGVLQNKRVIIQGWGNVASAAAYYQSQAGAKIVGIIDLAGGLIKPDGFSHDDITNLVINKQDNNLNTSNMLPFEEINEQIWHVGADIFIPAAASRLITKPQIDTMLNNGLELISCGANIPFADHEIFFGPIGLYVDKKISLLPDFIANCGMARVFSFLMQTNVEVTDIAIFADTSTTIRDALQESYTMNNQKTNISSTAFEAALKKIM